MGKKDDYGDFGKKDSEEEYIKNMSAVEPETQVPNNVEKARKAKNEELLIEAKGFFEFHKKKLGESLRKENAVIFINFTELTEFSNKLADEVIANPEEVLRVMELAIEEGGLIKNARVRLNNVPDSHKIKVRNIRSRHLNELIIIEGIVRQASDVRPQVVNARFECPSCGTIISVLQIDKKFREPSRCSCGRRGGFTLKSKEMVDTQRLIIEESPDSLTGGEQPKRINVFVKEDLVEPQMEEKTTPGARTLVIGILKEVPVPLQTGGLSTRFELAVEVNNIIPLEETFEDLDISEEDERQILELAQDPEVLKKLKASVAPSVWGYDEIKEALILQLFSGVQKQRSDGNKTRGDIHILMVGDPGVAKSVILTFMASISPKGRYVVGKSASGAGLTATVVKDEYLKGWSLEAGAMVLSNKGLVCIDELEKMDEQDRSAMHEAMEQQCMLPNFNLLLSNGRNVPIGKFVDSLMKKNKKEVYQGKNCEIMPVKNIELLSTDFENHFPMKASRISRHIAPKEFTKITLSNGREITVTPEHPCWIVKNTQITTIPAKKLNKNMFFPIPSKIKIKSQNYEKKNDYLCKILGYHISDGCYELNRKKKTGIQFWNNDENLIKDYLKSIEKYFGKKPIVVKRNNQFAARAISKKIVEEFKKLDESLLEKGNIKKIPEKIMQLPKENTKYLLRALYDGDGTVILTKRGGARISFVSQNKKLEEQMADLLLHFEIQSSIFWDEHSKVYRLDISGQENLSKFFLNINFLSKKKKERLKDYHKKSKTYRTIKDVIPECTTKINQIFKKLKISCRKEIGHSIDLNVEKQRLFLQKLVLIAEKKLNKILTKNPKEEKDYSELKTDLNNIKTLAFGYARWIKIKKVEKIKNKNIKWVYDVTIEPHHTFISNGMILHNTVTISKANVQATLKAQTSVLAAANPKFGRFDPYQGIAQQINLPPALINRFDVIFTLRDIPSKENDEKVATHILEEHQKAAKEMLIPRELFRKYVAYAKQKIKPKLTDPAVKKMKDFYVDLRNRPVSGNTELKPIPISARQLSAIIRMAEAIAKLRLSEEVSESDAEIAIKLMKYYLTQAGYDYETGQIDIDRISTNTSSSQRNKINTVKKAIRDLEEKVGKLIPLEELEKELEGKMDKIELEESINKLKINGDLFEPRRGYIQKT